MPPVNFSDLTALNFFKMFWDNSKTEILVDQTNLYSVQSTGKSINTSFNEMEQFIGIRMLMSIVKLPSYQMHWATETKYAPVADIMPISRFKKLRQYLHANNNALKDVGINKTNKVFKVQPILDAVRNNCIKTEPEEYHSIDKQIIPAKTKCSRIRQYNPKKPVKWGFKTFVSAGKSGIIYDFFLYQGGSTGTSKCNRDFVIKRLCKYLPSNENHKLMFDNWFTTLTYVCPYKLQVYSVPQLFAVIEYINVLYQQIKNLKSMVVAVVP